MATLTPAYGRDYKTKKEAIEAFEQGKDFTLNDFYTTCLVSKAELVKQGFKSVQLRYKGNTQVAVIKL